MWWHHPVPDSMEIRVVKVVMPIAGFRTRGLFVATDPLDPKPYRRRWPVGLIFRPIKTTLHMEVLRCESPAMIWRELHMHRIAYNLNRAVMLPSAPIYANPLCRVSCKGSCDTSRQCAPHLASVGETPTPAAGSFAPCSRSSLPMWSRYVPIDPNLGRSNVDPRTTSDFTKPRHLLGNLPHGNRPK